MPVSASVALAAGFLLVAVNVAESLSPFAVKAYETETVHVFFGPRLVAEHASAVMVNPDDPDARVRVTFSAEVAVPPVFVSVNVWLEEPLKTVPKSKAPLVAGDHAIEGAVEFADVPPLVACAAPCGTTADPMDDKCPPVLQAARRVANTMAEIARFKPRVI